MRKLTALAAGVLLVTAAEMSGAANAEPLDWEAVARCESGGRIMASRGPGAWAGCLTPAGSPAAAATVGSLAHYLTALSAGGPATPASAD
ncbi:hypothetical protein [Mycobacterium sp. UM_Kg1]|uniref:hypothetical protein n=1 Tax=Mycobacterium sp. UM_Kg1 TaxID=1545691 RepID=UPI00061AFC72|nr:hypothetical protein [Mycobacterium sp. UM_Kg1]